MCVYHPPLLTNFLSSLSLSPFTELEEELQISDNYASLKGKLLNLKTDLQDLAPDLTSHDLEIHSKRVDRLLKQLDDKKSLALNAGDKVLQFTKPPNIKVNLDQIKTRLSVDKGTTGSLLPFSIGKAGNGSTVSNEDLLISEDSNGVFENLSQCTVVTSPDLGNAPKSDTRKSGALTFKNLDKCVVLLATLPFKSGSLFFTDISDSVIVICIPRNYEMQIRLHNLTNCSISIQYANYSVDKQTVVVENLSRCIFHTSSMSQISIQNFNDVLGSETSTDTQNPAPGSPQDSDFQFKFGYFDTYMNDVRALREHYIGPVQVEQ